jgi:hypothetical protein
MEKLQNVKDKNLSLGKFINFSSAMLVGGVKMKIEKIHIYCDSCGDDITDRAKELNLPIVVLSSVIFLVVDKEFERSEYKAIGNKNYELCDVCYEETIKVIHDLFPEEPDGL